MARPMQNYVDVGDPAVLATHGASIGAIVATALGYLPIVVALIPAIYYMLLIYESKTVQGWVHKRRARKRVIRVAKAKAAKKVADAKVEAAKLVTTVASTAAVDAAKK